MQVVGDDFLVTDARRGSRAPPRAALPTPCCSSPTRRGTLTETRAALRCGARGRLGGIVSARSGETEDVTIVHLAVGWNAGQLKVGSFARGERMAKWNEVLRIEEALGDRARFAAEPRSALLPER